MGAWDFDMLKGGCHNSKLANFALPSDFCFVVTVLRAADLKLAIDWQAVFIDFLGSSDIRIRLPFSFVDRTNCRAA